MATLPLAVGSVTGCEWEGHGQMLLRDNTGNGNLIWISQYTNLDIRVSIDNGATWTEPTSLGAAGQFGSTWAQDSAGNLHGVLPNGASNAVYRKITLTRTAGDITSAAETTTFTLACITDSALGRSWSIAVVSDGQASPIERVAIAWMDAKLGGAGAGQRLSVRFVVTTEATGVSPTLATHFKAFDETTGTGELLRNSTGGATGTATGFMTKIAQMPSTASVPYRLYVALRMYDTTDASERLTEIQAAAWNNVATAPFWGAFASLATGATPAEALIHNIDLLADATNNRVILACMDTTSTTAKTLDIWVVASDGTLDKNTTFAQISFASLINKGRSGKLALDQNGLLWAFFIGVSAIGVNNIGVAYYSGGAWTVNYQYADILSIEDIVVSRTSNASNRVFYAVAMDGVDTDPCVMSANLSSEIVTLKTSGGTYSSVAVALEHAPDLVLYDWTINVSWKSGGWSGPTYLSQSSVAGNSSFRTVTAGVTFTFQAASGEGHQGKWDTGKVYFTGSDALYPILLRHPAGTGTFAIDGLQAEYTGTGANPPLWIYDIAVEASPEATTVRVSRCIARQATTSVSTAAHAISVYIQPTTVVADLSVDLIDCVTIIVSGTTNTAAAISLRHQPSTAAGAVRALNCSVYNGSTTATTKGIQQESAAGQKAVTAINCVVEMATATSDRSFVDAGSGWGASSNYNVAGGPAASNNAPGANSLSDQTAAQIGFVDKANGDLHIGADSVCIRAGTNLTSDFRDDIDGNPRPFDTVAWDVGADQRWFPDKSFSKGLACGLSRGLG